MKCFMGKFFSVRFVMGIFVLSYIFIVALIATQCYISELKSDVAQHAMTQYISENGWAEQVVSLKCALTGDDNERCIIINYANDELRYEYFYFLGAHEKTSGISAPIIYAFSEQMHFDPVPLVVVMTMIVFFLAFLTPAASPYAAMMHGNTEWIQTRDIYKYGSITIILGTIVCAVIGVPLATFLFGIF